MKSGCKSNFNLCAPNLIDSLNLHLQHLKQIPLNFRQPSSPFKPIAINAIKRQGRHYLASIYKLDLSRIPGIFSQLAAFQINGLSRQSARATGAATHLAN